MKFKKTHDPITETGKAPPHQKRVPYTNASIIFYVGLTHTLKFYITLSFTYIIF